MKKSDIAMLILIASVAVMVAFFIAQSLPFLKVDEKGREVATFETITSDIVEPTESVYGEKAINPTVRVFVKQQGGE